MACIWRLIRGPVPIRPALTLRLGLLRPGSQAWPWFRSDAPTPHAASPRLPRRAAACGCGVDDGRCGSGGVRLAWPQAPFPEAGAGGPVL